MWTTIVLGNRLIIQFRYRDMDIFRISIDMADYMEKKFREDNPNIDLDDCDGKVLLDVIQYFSK